MLFGLLLPGLVGCRLIDGGDSSGPDVVAAPTSVTTVSTIVTRPVVAGSALRDVKASLLAAVTTEVVTGARVTLTLSDGTTYTMTDNGNGKYTATVTNLQNAKGFVIEAHKGDLVVQNLVTDLQNTDLANLTTDHLTTTFAQVALAFAKNEGTLQLATVADLIKNVTAITIDLTALYKEVVDETNVTYTQQRQLFTAALAEANPEAGEATMTILEQIEKGIKTLTTTTLTWNDTIVQPIAEGELQPPVVLPVDDETQVKLVTEQFMNFFGKAMTGTALSATEINEVSALLGDTFLNNGKNKNDYLSFFANPENDNEEEDFVGFTGRPVFRKIDATTYLVGLSGTVTFRNKTTQTLRTDIIESFRDGYTFDGNFQTYRANALANDDFFPMVIKKFTDGSWKLLGNGSKVDRVDIHLNFLRGYWNVAQPDQYNDQSHLWFQVEDVKNFPVRKVEVSGGKVTGTLTLEKNPAENDSNAWNYWASWGNDSTRHPSAYPATGWPLTGEGSVTHQNGDTYTFKVTYTDNSVQTFIFPVSGLTSNDKPLLNATIAAGATSFNVTWPASQFADFDGYEIFADAIAESGNNRIFYQETANKALTSASIAYQSSSYTLTPGALVNIQVQSRRKNNINSSLARQLRVPGGSSSEGGSASLPAAQADTLKAIGASVKTIGQGLKTVPALPAPASALSSSIRAVINDVPSQEGLWPLTGWRYIFGEDREPLEQETDCFVYSSGTYDSYGLYPIVRLFDNGDPMQVVGYDPAPGKPNPWSAVPAKVWMRVLLRKQLTNGLVAANLETQGGTNQPITLVAGGTPLYFTGSGNFTGSINGVQRNFSLNITMAATDVTAQGRNVDGTFQANFSIDQTAYILDNAIFDANGLKAPANQNQNLLKQGNTVLGQLSVNDQGALVFTPTSGSPIVLQ
ncbi:MAG: hypothetical protein OZSIB_0209 [Candidatus Ozemobacter sibiricus]|uniref:Uncharacterized protein n=1 Tax=Candidatus Ozemobacter sibiricus TaxID=2268124 RepID=A0A367ZMI6_9BACT|nr:MAG: hypothetical protein OZSIB_0209 [Candidatus Ozemobacter sibiricus]